MTDLNSIKSYPASEAAYIVLDRESGDFQEVNATIAHALESDLQTMTVGLTEDREKIFADINGKEDTRVALDLAWVREMANKNEEKITFAAQMFIKQQIPCLNNEALAELVKGIGKRNKVIIIFAGFSY